MPRTVEFTVMQGNITTYAADVVAMKFAQKFYGADKAVSHALIRANVPEDNLQPPTGKYRYVPTNGAIKAPFALFLGVVPLMTFRYEHARAFCADALRILGDEAPDTKHVAMIIHGAGFGLDESEACRAQFAGCVQALDAGEFPHALERISFVEIVGERVERFRQTLDDALRNVDYAVRVEKPGKWAYQFVIETPEQENAASSSTEIPVQRAVLPDTTEAKPHAFIAMPFADEWDDVFYYGIQTPVHAAGLLCERVDKSAFTGDIMGYVRQRIETAAVVIAEISNANPNVYLEVGYAWGKDRPTILIVQHDKELHFDVQGQKCLTYKKIKDLEAALDRELKGMLARRIIASA